MTGRVHSILSLSALDGPGLRAVVFMQGCPLRCSYCHNPDTWEAGGGMEMSVDEVLAALERSRPYFGASGGVTASGGEPLMQAGFVSELFSACRDRGIHTALDTSGCIPPSAAAGVLDYTDLCILDIKATDRNRYTDITGGSIENTLDMLCALKDRDIDTWARQVIVPGINADARSALSLKALTDRYLNVSKVELLPFRKLCEDKYREMNIPFRLAGYPEPDGDMMAELNDIVARL